jgi:hypothetical protein
MKRSRIRVSLMMKIDVCIAIWTEWMKCLLLQPLQARTSCLALSTLSLDKDSKGATNEQGMA